MNKNKPLEKRTKDENENLIIDTIKKENPATTKQLVALIQERYNLTEEQITKLLIDLENEGKLHCVERPLPTPTSAKDYIFSQRATWFWITIALSLSMVITVFTIPESAYPFVYIRNLLGTIFVLFLPSYTFIKTLFPSKVPIPTSSENMDNIERVALSVGMGLALVPIVGLILNYTPWGIRLAPVTLSLLALTVAFATAAILREYQTKTTQTK
jgi:hypothetical protein